MLVEFPYRPNNWGLTETRIERNAYARPDEVTLLDVIYTVHELEMLVGSMSGSFELPESDLEQVQTTVEVLSGQVSSLVALMALKPDYLEGVGPPADSIGKNGDTYWDTAPASSSGQVEYRKAGNQWRQQP